MSIFGSANRLNFLSPNIFKRNLNQMRGLYVYVHMYIYIYICKNNLDIHIHTLIYINICISGGGRAGARWQTEEVKTYCVYI